MNGRWLASDPSWLSLLMLKQVQMTAFKKVCLWEVSKTLSREDRYLVCVVLCFCCIIFQNGTRALSAVSAALHASNAWLSIFFFLSVFNMKYSCGIFHPSTVESNNNNQFRLDFFFLHSCFSPLLKHYVSSLLHSSWFEHHLSAAAPSPVYSVQKRRSQTFGTNTFRTATLQPLTVISANQPSPAHPALAEPAVPQERGGEIQAEFTPEQGERRLIS